MGYKIGGGYMPDKKIGRPTDNPKSRPIHVRLDKECREILDIYCKENNVSLAEGIRKGIKMLGNVQKK